MSTFQELDALIEAGWGDVPQTQIPPDWQTQKPPLKFYEHTTHAEVTQDEYFAAEHKRKRRRRTYAELRADRKAGCP